jgi:hypothetical protein
MMKEIYTAIGLARIWHILFLVWQYFCLFWQYSVSSTNHYTTNAVMSDYNVFFSFCQYICIKNMHMKYLSNDQSHWKSNNLKKQIYTMYLLINEWQWLTILAFVTLVCLWLIYFVDTCKVCLYILHVSSNIALHFSCDQHKNMKLCGDHL